MFRAVESGRPRADSADGDHAAGRIPAGRDHDRTGNKSFYAGSMRDGAIYRGDLLTGTGGVLVPGEQGRAVLGMKVDSRTGSSSRTTPLAGPPSMTRRPAPDWPTTRLHRSVRASSTMWWSSGTRRTSSIRSDRSCTWSRSATKTTVPVSAHWDPR